MYGLECNDPFDFSLELFVSKIVVALVVSERMDRCSHVSLIHVYSLSLFSSLLVSAAHDP